METDQSEINAGRGRGTEMKPITSARNARIKVTALPKRGPGRPRSQETSKQQPGKMRTKSIDFSQNKGKGKERIEETTDTMDTQSEEGEKELTEETKRKRRGGNEKPDKEDTRDSSPDAYSENATGAYKEQMEQPKEVTPKTTKLGKKPRHNCEIEIPSTAESALMAETIEEACVVKQSFLGVRVARGTAGKKKIIASFGDTIDMQEACEINFGTDENKDYLIPVEYKILQPEERSTVIVRDIPLTTSEGTVKALLRKFGEIDSFTIRPIEMWQTAKVTFKNENDAKLLANLWSIPFGKEHLRILPQIEEKETLKVRSENVLKLAGLPAGTTAYDLTEISREVAGKTLYIPRTNRYYRERYAYVAFESEKEMLEAKQKTFKLGRFNHKMVGQFTQLCYKCGQNDHYVYKCEEIRMQ
jgi:hypothetical protein